MTSQPETGLVRLELRPTDALTEAGCKVLGYHFRQMLAHEAGTRLGVDSEELHDMRVATRRMRSAVRVFAPYFDDAALRPLAKRLRRTGLVLGRVRDLDVLIERTNSDIMSLPNDERRDLAPLLDGWQAQRQAARREMLAYLNSRRYERFVQAFRDFGDTDPSALMPRDTDRLPVPVVQAQAPVLIHAAYKALLHREPVPNEQALDALHELRIECKRFRYTLEFFRDVLGPQAGKVIREVVAVQDHLGALVDARVAIRLLEEFLGPSAGTASLEATAARGAGRYLAAKREELAVLLRGVPGVWDHFRRAAVGQALSAATAALRAPEGEP